MDKKRELTGREELFCGLMALYGAPFEAARQAGYRRTSRPRAVVELLGRPDIRMRINELYWARRSATPDRALARLERIASADNRDAVWLAQSGGGLSREEMEKLDLFAVSEIDFGRGGGMKVKMLDKKAANAVLLEYGREMSGRDQMRTLLEALDGTGETAPADNAD